MKKTLNIIITVFTLIGISFLLGGIGSFEWTQITFGRFITMELVAFVSLLIAYITYAIKINIKPKKAVK